MLPLFFSITSIFKHIQYHMEELEDKAFEKLLGKRIKELRKELGIPMDPILLSAHSGEGKHEVIERIREIIKT